VRDFQDGSQGKKLLIIQNSFSQKFHQNFSFFGIEIRKSSKPEKKNFENQEFILNKDFSILTTLEIEILF